MNRKNFSEGSAGLVGCVSAGIDGGTKGAGPAAKNVEIWDPTKVAREGVSHVRDD